MEVAVFIGHYPLGIRSFGVENRRNDVFLHILSKNRPKEVKTAP